MKLAEIEGKRSISVIADLMENIGEIATDKKALEFFKPVENSKLSPAEIGIQRIFGSLPYLLRNHEKALYSILAIVNDVPYDEYVAKTNVIKIGQDVKELLSNEDIKQLFTFAKPSDAEN